jgi:hypothetical protein
MDARVELAHDEVREVARPQQVRRAYPAAILLITAMDGGK